MKREFAIILSAATVSFALLSANVARAQSATGMGSGEQEAMQMVSARVALKQDVDAGKIKQGEQIRTILADKVVLKNGTELPAGTTILGVVATDDMQLNGTSKLALNFTTAELKNGKVVPIKATIVGVYPPESVDANGNPVKPGDQEVGSWTNHADAVDEIGALPGVDLHSKVGSSNSGVLVSTTKHDMKLKWGSEIALAVAAQTQGE
jgi:hypothetical protein